MTTPASWDAGRVTKLVFSLYAIAVFAILWLALGTAIAGNPQVADDTWHWLQDLPTALQVVAGIVLLPMVVGLWAWHANLGLALGMLVLIGLIAWTILPVASLARAIRGGD